ncbi:glycosyltransferase [Frigoribacterium sp. 2-23]|uniref:glycosyltransferase n=1 Tax=Frigoribacterium sp. 2-23 TaxID=3415006 RepID=UPI003C6FF1A6
MPSTPETPLRIALVSLHTSPFTDPGSGDAGGMNVVVRHQAEALGALGHHVDVITRRSSPDMPAVSSPTENVTLRVLDAGPAEVVPKGRHEEFIHEFRDRLAELGPYDVLHSHHWFSGMAALPVARDRGIPHLQSFHSIAADASTPLSHGERPESHGRLEGEAFLAQNSDRVIAISQAERQTIVTRLHGDPERIVVVAPGVDTQLFHPVDDLDRPDEPFALAAGRLEPLKGPDLAIDAIAAVASAVRPELVIAGGASTEFADYERELRQRATEAGIGDSVRFVGPQTRPHLAALLRRASVVLVPSHSETYGLIALEAAASGVPVVAADAGGLHEAVVDGVTGVIMTSREPAAWGLTVSRILADPQLAGSLGAAAREHALARPWSRSAHELADVYCGLSERPGVECRPEAVPV